jgi:biotin carboxyl carrier protein
MRKARVTKRKGKAVKNLSPNSDPPMTLKLNVDDLVTGNRIDDNQMDEETDPGPLNLSGPARKARVTKMEVETDKATVQVPSPVAGTLLEIFFKDGDEIKTGDAIAICESN